MSGNNSKPVVTTLDQVNDSNIAIMGGMFDPVHLGHISTALMAIEKFQLDQLYLVPCGSPVHRNRANASDNDRLEMLNLAIEDLSTKQKNKITVDARECLAKEPSYAYNTISSIKNEHPDSRLFFILGVDAFNLMHSWYKWREMFEMTHFIVVKRPGWDLELKTDFKMLAKQLMVSDFDGLLQSQAGKILVCDLASLLASSSQIRESISAGTPIQDLLSKRVNEYIHIHQLYGSIGA